MAIPPPLMPSQLSSANGMTNSSAFSGRSIGRTQSWFDLPLAQPGDPRGIISAVSLDDNTGVSRSGLFINSSTFLNNTTWQNSPISLSPGTGATTPFCAPVSPADYEGIYLAQQWQNSHGIVRSNTQLPPTVQKIVFFKAYDRFVTTIFLDIAGGVSSTDIQLSLRDNSVVGGNFITGSATVPVFAWSGNTFSGSSRKFSISTRGPGRVLMVLRVIDNAGNWSMFEMDWVIVP